MPRLAVALVVALMLLTGFAVGQLREISTVRSDLSHAVAVPQQQVKSDLALETTFEPISTLSPLEAAISPRTPRLERLTMNRFAQHSVVTQGGTMISVETGSVVVHVSNPTMGFDRAWSALGENVSEGVFHLRAAENLVIAPHSAYWLSNRDLQPARLLVLTVPHFDRASDPELPPPGISLPDGVVREESVSGAVIAPNRGPLRIDMYLVTPVEFDAGSLTPPGTSLLFVAGKTLLSTPEYSSVSEAIAEPQMWIATISELAE